MPDQIQEYIVITDSPNYTMLDQKASPEIKELYEKERTGGLPKPKDPNTFPKAALHITPDLLFEQYWDEEDQTMKQRYLKVVVAAETDDRGRARIHKDKPHVARQLIKAMRHLGRKAELDPMGLQLPEEMDEDERPPVNKGGRPKKVQ